MQIQQRRYWLTTFLVFLFCSFNATASDRLAQDFIALPHNAKIVLMPMDVELFSMSAGGVLEPKAEWTERALDNLKTAFHSRTNKNGTSFMELADDQDIAIDELNRLHGAVGAAINIHHLGGLKLPTKENRLEWSLGPDVALIKQKTGADYALFTFVRDSYASAERKAAVVAAALFGVGLQMGAQVGYASLVDLSNGNVLWFNRLLRASGDLREMEPAKESLNSLLQGFPD